MNSKIKQILKKDSTVKSIESLKAVGYAFLIGVFLILITGQGGNLLHFFDGFWDKNFGNALRTSNTLAKLSYLIPLSLALVVSFRMGLFNIGAAGQALGGGVFAYIIGCSLKVGQFGWIFALIFGVLVGAGIAALIGWLKVRFKINEVISSIMINWIIFYIVRYISFPNNLHLDSNPGGDLRMDWLYDLFGVKSGSMNIGILIAIPLPFIFWFLYSKTKWGYKQDLIGNNPKTGEYLGIDSNREIIKTMFISGALAGLAGTIYYLGYDIFIPSKSASELPGWTFDGITIALLGFNSPIGIIFSSFIYSLFNDQIDLLIGDNGIIAVMVSVMIIFVAKSTYRINYGPRGYIKWIKEKTGDFRNKRKGGSQ